MVMFLGEDSFVSFAPLLCCRTPNRCDCGLMFLCFHFVMELQIVMLCDMILGFDVKITSRQSFGTCAMFLQFHIVLGQILII
jgi:hypothetical protein